MNRRQYHIDDLDFIEIDFDLHEDICIRFRADSYTASFGNDDGFWGEDGLGAKRYIEWLKSKDRKKYGSFHIWLNGEIIGQMELGLFHRDESFGYVNLYYLKEVHRGKGLSSRLDDFTKKFLEELGVNKVRLCVSPSNERAWSFYIKQGWKDAGPRNPDSKDTLVHWMEKTY